MRHAVSTIFRAIADVVAPAEQRSAMVKPSGLFLDSNSTDAGVHVTPDVALTHSAVWACVTAISEAFATLPVHVKKQKDGTKAGDHTVHRLLHEQPNDFMSPAVFRTAMMTNALLWGRAIAYIDRDAAGRPVGLYPVPSCDVRAERKGGLLAYHVRQNAVKWTQLRPDEVFDLLWMSGDGVNPLGPIQNARHTIGLSIALTRYAAKFFSNGGHLGGIINTGSMPADAAKEFLASWRAKYTGVANSFKLAALPAGMSYEAIGSDPEKGQLTDVRASQVIEVCRIFRVPPHKVHELGRATWSNIEHAAIQWVQDTLLPWAVRWEQEADRKLLLERERRRLEVKFNLDALLRADTATRYAAHRTGIESGILTQNEARRAENLPPLPGGDVLLRPANTMPSDGQPSADSQKPDPDPEPAADPAGDTNERNEQPEEPERRDSAEQPDPADEPGDDAPDEPDA